VLVRVLPKCRLSRLYLGNNFFSHTMERELISIERSGNTEIFWGNRRAKGVQSADTSESDSDPDTCAEQSDGSEYVYEVEGSDGSDDDEESADILEPKKCRSGASRIHLPRYTAPHLGSRVVAAPSPAAPSPAAPSAPAGPSPAGPSPAAPSPGPSPAAPSPPADPSPAAPSPTAAASPGAAFPACSSPLAPEPQTISNLNPLIRKSGTDDPTSGDTQPTTEPKLDPGSVTEVEPITSDGPLADSEVVVADSQEDDFMDVPVVTGEQSEDPCGSAAGDVDASVLVVDANDREAWHALVNAVECNTSARQIQITSCVRPDEFARFCNALKSNTATSSLNLDGCNVGDAGCGALANMLVVNVNLMVLDMQNNFISDNGLEAIGNALKEARDRSGLQQLKVADARITDRGVMLLLATEPRFQVNVSRCNLTSFVRGTVERWNAQQVPK